jgi:hypothetical protein
MPTKKLRKALVYEVKEIFVKYKLHKDRINLREKWCYGQTREDKLVGAIEGILEKNLR